MTESIRVGIVGSGGMAGHRAATFSSLDGCELVAVAARNSETGAELAGKHDLTLTADWQELVRREDVDAVAVCTNNDSHAVMASAPYIRGGPRNSDSVLSWSPTSIGRSISHEHTTEFLS